MIHGLEVDLNCTKLSTKFMVLDFTQSIKKIHGQLSMDLEQLRTSSNNLCNKVLASGLHLCQDKIKVH